MSDTVDLAVGNRDKNVAWYTKGEPSLSDGTKQLLETYSKIPADEVLPHVIRTRDEAWEIFPYPCIGQWRFLELSIGRQPYYPEILERLKSGKQIFLDLGCCFGQDIRRLVADGAPSENCYGSDLKFDFMDLGYKLFLDKDTLKSTFIAGDIFDDDSDLKQLHGKADILHTASFFHLFDLEKQKQIARRCIKLLKPQKDSLIVGRQVGNVNAGVFDHKTNVSNHMYRHNDESWKKMWDDVGEETGTQWHVESRLLDWREGHQMSATTSTPIWHQGGGKRLQFTVRRMA